MRNSLVNLAACEAFFLHYFFIAVA